MGMLSDMVFGRLLGLVGSEPEVIDWDCEVPIGASGATGTLAFQPNGMAVAKSDTGVYAVTGMPICPAGKGRITFGIYSPAPTVGGAVVTVVDFTAGTMTFETLVGVTATEPASGDKIWIKFRGSPR